MRHIITRPPTARLASVPYGRRPSLPDLGDVTLTRSASEAGRRVPRLRFGLVSVLAASAILVATSSLPARAQDLLAELPTVRWGPFAAEMVELKVGSSRAYVVKPLQPATDGSKPWIWYAPSLSTPDGKWALPSDRHAEVVKPLLEKGFYFCGVDVGESYGSPAGRRTFTEFHRTLVDRFGLAPKACLFPVSRGGLMHYNWAVEHPECVARIGAIYPVCDLTSYPRLAKAAKTYELTEEQLRKDLANHNPIDRLGPLAAAGVPIFHVHGDSDTVVPLETNSAELARRYKAAGGKIEILVIPGKGHEIAPEIWRQAKLAKFFLEEIKAR